jgi:hypothetical protein
METDGMIGTRRSVGKFVANAAATLAVICGLLGAAGPAGAQPGCALPVPAVSARLAAPRYEGVVGRPVAIEVVLEPEQVPAGFFVVCAVEPVSSPGGVAPDVLPGFPTSDVTPRAPGEHRLTVTAHLVGKSSCGGVLAIPLFEGEATLLAR